MNKEQTTIERDALEWYNRLSTYDRMFMEGFNTQEIILAYTAAEHPTAPTVGLEKKEDWLLFSETKPANKQNIYYWFGGKKEGVYNSHTNTVSGTVKLPKYWKPIEIAPTVENKEDSSSEMELALAAYFIEHAWSEKEIKTESVRDMAENSQWVKGYLAAKQENKKLLEDNKLLREALQKINNIEDGAFGLSNFDVARFKKDIQQALEQTK